MIRLCALALLVVAAVAVPRAPQHKSAGITQQLVDEINSKQSTWTAKLHSRFAGATREQMRGMLGARKRSEKPNPRRVIQPKSTGPNDDIPESFNIADKWPECKDVFEIIADQSSCGSCWAVSSASVMSDRLCIATGGKNKTPISSNDIISCCYDCGFGCQGGWPDESFQYWQDTGVVSGSGYTTDTGCQPYPFAECEHHTNKTRYPACPKDIYDTPSCSKSCQKSYTAHTYKEDKIFGVTPVYYSGDVAAIQREIMTSGSVVFAYDVYADFVVYAKGVYKHTTGDWLGGHAVRAVGWGVEDGTPYWLIANSWNEDWAELGGYFKIIRGEDNCGIEDEVAAGTANVNNLPSKH